MKYVGSREYDSEHIQDSHIPLRAMSGSETCRFAAYIAQNTFVKKFNLVADDGFSASGSDAGELEKWLAHCVSNDIALKEATYQIRKYAIKISFSFSGELSVIREKADRTHYSPMLQAAERSVIYGFKKPRKGSNVGKPAKDSEKPTS